MAGGNHRELTKAEVESLLARLDGASLRKECLQCECLQGFIAQLEMDAADDAKPLLARYKVVPKKVHACLGCEPCLPAEVFAQYLARRRGK